MRLSIRCTAVVIALSFGQLLLADGGLACAGHGANGEGAMHSAAVGAERGAARAANEMAGAMSMSERSLMDPDMRDDCGQNGPTEACGSECAVACPASGGCAGSLSMTCRSAATSARPALGDELPIAATPEFAWNVQSPEPPPPRA